MAEKSSKARHWNGFVCPECRYVFRVARGHDGRGVVCPSCRRLLSLPLEGERAPELMLPAQSAAAAQPSPQEEIDTAQHEDPKDGRVKRRRRKRNKKAEELFDETFAGKKRENPVLIRGVIASLVLVGVVLLIALLWPKRGDDASPTGTRNGGGKIVAVEPREADPADAVARNQVVSPPMVEGELVPVYRKFLSAKTMEDMAEFVLHPEITLPRMKEFYAEGFSSVPFKSIVWSPFNHRDGDWITIAIEDSDFEQRAISAKNEDGWKIDWESWVGWSEMTWKELREKRPQTAKRFRVKVGDVVYYNFSFMEESKWNSYLLQSPDGQSSVYGYVPRGGELDAMLQQNDVDILRHFLLKLKFPDGAPSDNQVVIEEVITKGWLDTQDDS